MAVTRMSTAFDKNTTASDSSKKPRRIRECESDALINRFREILGSESVSSFSRRCKVSESTLRNILDGAFPRTDILVAIADAGAVTIDWLATGRPPKTRAELNALVKGATEAAVSSSIINIDALEAILEGALKVAHNAPASAVAAHCAKVYKQCIDDGLITPEGMGDGHLNAAA